MEFFSTFHKKDFWHFLTKFAVLKVCHFLSLLIVKGQWIFLVLADRLLDVLSRQKFGFAYGNIAKFRNFQYSLQFSSCKLLSYLWFLSLVANKTLSRLVRRSKYRVEASRVLAMIMFFCWFDYFCFSASETVCLFGCLAGIGQLICWYYTVGLSFSFQSLGCISGLVLLCVFTIFPRFCAAEKG